MSSTGQNQHRGSGTAHRCGEAHRGRYWEVVAQGRAVLRSPGPVLLPRMSSSSSNPEDGDTTEQSQLGLDTVIQVSEVAAPSLTPLKSRS